MRSAHGTFKKYSCSVKRFAHKKCLYQKKSDIKKMFTRFKKMHVAFLKKVTQFFCATQKTIFHTIQIHVHYP